MGVKEASSFPSPFMANTSLLLAVPEFGHGVLPPALGTGDCISDTVAVLLVPAKHWIVIHTGIFILWKWKGG